MAILPGVLGCRLLRRTVQVRLGSNFGFRISDFEFKKREHKIRAQLEFRIPQSAFCIRLLGGTPIFMVSRRQFMKHPG
jgi:hypothetical protein